LRSSAANIFWHIHLDNENPDVQLNCMTLQQQLTKLFGKACIAWYHQLPAVSALLPAEALAIVGHPCIRGVWVRLETLMSRSIAIWAQFLVLWLGVAAAAATAASQQVHGRAAGKMRLMSFLSSFHMVADVASVNKSCSSDATHNALHSAFIQVASHVWLVCSIQLAWRALAQPCMST
jgi:hypothetical protein